MSILREGEDLELDLGLDEADDADALRVLVAAKLRMKLELVPAIEIRRRAIDARHGRVRFHLTVGVPEPAPGQLGGAPPRAVSGAPVIIVGDGPTGLFCAYELARQGTACIVLDRGKPVQARRRDLKGLTQHGRVDADSNYCFGEGGAGTYSDGKLYTRAHKRGDVRDVLELLAVHGAPAEILVDARPHIGSNKLPKVITALREHLESVGVQFRFGARVVGLERDTGGVRGVRLADGEVIAGREVVMATGHSARDVLRFLDDAGVALEAKPFAMGVRVEHPQAMIDRIQYGKSAGHPKLRAAPYRVANTPPGGRGVFSFCMCPGGWIVPASTDADGLVVNGMSLSRRDSPFANSGLVVAIELADLGAQAAHGVFAGLELQAQLERAAKQAGGGDLRAPAQRIEDFLANRMSTSLPATSYEPGLTSASIADVLDATGLPLAQRMREAMGSFDKTLRGFAGGDGIMVGVESRTSSPVRVPRDPSTLMSPSLGGLYPAGEGAGYAGGIVSAAMDGVRVARAIIAARS